MRGDGIVCARGERVKDQRLQGVMWQSMPKMFRG